MTAIVVGEEFERSGAAKTSDTVRQRNSLEEK